MTCIAAVVKDGKICMGGDAAAVNGSGDIFAVRNPKVFQKGSILFGYAGEFRYGQLIQYLLKIPEKQTGQTDMEYLVSLLIPAIQACLDEGGNLMIENEKKTSDYSLMIIGYNKKIYQIGSNFMVIENCDNYLSIGIGECYALGSLYTTESPDNAPIESRVQWALEAATHLHGGVRPPYTILTI